MLHLLYLNDLNGFTLDLRDIGFTIIKLHSKVKPSV